MEPGNKKALRQAMYALEYHDVVRAEPDGWIRGDNSWGALSPVINTGKCFHCGNRSAVICNKFDQIYEVCVEPWRCYRGRMYNLEELKLSPDQISIARHNYNHFKSRARRGIGAFMPMLKSQGYKRIPDAPAGALTLCASTSGELTLIGE